MVPILRNGILLPLFLFQKKKKIFFYFFNKKKKKKKKKKKGDLSNYNNYRRISLINIDLKIISGNNLSVIT